jgi:hypothetical protein
MGCSCGSVVFTGLLATRGNLGRSLLMILPNFSPFVPVGSDPWRERRYDIHNLFGQGDRVFVKYAVEKAKADELKVLVEQAEPSANTNH